VRRSGTSGCVACWGDFMRLAAVVAAAAAVVNLLVLGLLHVVSPEVDPVNRPVSEYALGGFGWLATARTLVEGVGAIALAVALLLGRAMARRVERAAALLLLVVGLLKLAMPLFPVDALGTPATSAGQVHNILGKSDFFPVSISRPSTVPSVGANGQPTGSRGRSGAGGRDSWGVGNTIGGSAWPSVPTWFCPRSGSSSPL
jgi:Protein of unknown function (DUF998)